MKRFLKKLIVALRPKVHSEDIIATAAVFEVSPDYIKSEFIIDKELYAPTFYVRFDVIED